MKCSGKAIKRTSSDISPLSPARFVHINRLGKYFLDFAKNATIELGGPDALSPLEVMQLFEQQSGKTFLVNHVPIEALQAQKAAATDPLQESFAALMLGYATEHVIDMTKVLEAIPVQLASVKDYAAQVTSGEAAANV